MPCYKFTGKERDAESNLDNFTERYFSSQTGRFMSPDPGPWIFLNPQSYNAYTYGLDNPERYTDDSGMTAQDRVNAANTFASEDIPYVYGGKNPSCGLDCPGLVQNVFAADPDNTIPGLDNVLSAAGQASALKNQGYFSTDINNAEPGDAIFFTDSSGHVVHTGIVVSVKDGKVYFIHAPHPGPHEKVKQAYVSIKSKMFGNERFAGVGRPIEPTNIQTKLSQTRNSNGWSLSNLLEDLFFNWTPPPPPPPTPAVNAFFCGGPNQPPCD